MSQMSQYHHHNSRFDDVNTNSLRVKSDAKFKNIHVKGDINCNGKVSFSDSVEFHGKVSGIDAIKSIDCCDVCKEDRETPEGTFGFEWDEEMDLNLSQSQEHIPNEDASERTSKESSIVTRKICMTCIWETAMMYKTKQRFESEYGNPMSNILTKMHERFKKMEREIQELKSRKLINFSV